MGDMLMQGLAGGVYDASNVALSAVMEMANMLTSKLESLVNQITQLMNFAGSAIQPFGIGDEEDQQNISVYAQQVSDLTLREQEQTTAVTLLNQAYQALVGLCAKLVEMYKALVESSNDVIKALDEQVSAYDRVTSSIERQIAALQKLQSLQAAASAASTISAGESALKSSGGSGYHFDYSKSGSGWTEAEMREGFIPAKNNSSVAQKAAVAAGVAASAVAGATFVFNSPKAIVPTTAAKLLKQTAQQISMSIK